MLRTWRLRLSAAAVTRGAHDNGLVLNGGNDDTTCDINNGEAMLGGARAGVDAGGEAGLGGRGGKNSSTTINYCRSNKNKEISAWFVLGVAGE
jgi:hypothetical protein